MLARVVNINKDRYSNEAVREYVKYKGKVARIKEHNDEMFEAEFFNGHREVLFKWRFGKVSELDIILFEGTEEWR